MKSGWLSFSCLVLAGAFLQAAAPVFWKLAMTAIAYLLYQSARRPSAKEFLKMMILAGEPTSSAEELRRLQSI